MYLTDMSDTINGEQVQNADICLRLFESFANSTIFGGFILLQKAGRQRPEAFARIYRALAKQNLSP